MLFLKSAKGEIYYLTPKQEHIVSRKGGQLILLEDQSISRQHAVIRIEQKDSGAYQEQIVVLEDLGSKYGTFIIDGVEPRRLSPKITVTITPGDSIRFGLQWNVWTLMRLAVCMSTLNQSEKQQVKQTVQKLGGSITSEWTNQSTHLTMSRITLTVKVVCAISCCGRIVAPGYWQAVLEAVGTGSVIPPPESFSPPLAEATLNGREVSFNPVPKRTALFANMTFFVATQQQAASVEQMVTPAGGRVVLLTSDNAPNENRLRTDTDMVVVRHTANKVVQPYMVTANRLSVLGLRLIPESEIGLSIVYCSKERYCNPAFDLRKHLLQSASSSPSVASSILVPDTQVLQDGVPPYKFLVPTFEDWCFSQLTSASAAIQQITSAGQVVPDTLDDSIGSMKRSREEDLLSMSASKRRHPSNESTNPCEVIEENSTKEIHEIKNARGAPRLKKQCFNDFPVPQLVSVVKKARNMSSSVQHQDGVLTSRTNDRIEDREDLFSFDTIKKVTTNLKATGEDDLFSFDSIKKKPVGNLLKSHETVVGDELTSPSKSSHLRQKNRQSERSNENSGDIFSSEVKRKFKRSASMDTNESAIREPTNKASGKRARTEIKKASCTYNSRQIPVDDKDVFVFPSDQMSVSGIAQGDAFDFPSDCRLETKPSSSDVISDDEDFNQNQSKQPKINRTVTPTPAVVKKELQSVTKTPQRFRTVQHVSMKDFIHVGQELHDQLPIKKEELEEGVVSKLTEALRFTAVIEVRPLVVIRDVTDKPSTSNTSQINFKKFRKNGVKRSIPHIIGGSDLYAHTEQSRVHCDWLEQTAVNNNANMSDEEDDRFAFTLYRPKAKARQRK